MVITSLKFFLITAVTYFTLKNLLFPQQKNNMPLDRSDDLLGIDSIGDGLRDDVRKFIASKSLSLRKKKATLRLAKANHKMMMANLKNPHQMREIDRELIQSVVCLSDLFASDGDAVNGLKLLYEVRAISFNTKESAKKYIDFDRYFSGKSTTIPDQSYCDENNKK